MYEGLVGGEMKAAVSKNSTGSSNAVEGLGGLLFGREGIIKVYNNATSHVTSRQQCSDPLRLVSFKYVP